MQTLYDKYYSLTNENYIIHFMAFSFFKLNLLLYLFRVNILLKRSVKLLKYNFLTTY